VPVKPLEEMSGSELLDHVDVLARAQRRCEVEILRAAVQHAGCTTRTRWTRL
jgi:hypothetical protein